MDLDQLNGRCQRMKDELAHAYAQEPWPTGRIDRLIEEIAAMESEIANARSQDRADIVKVPTRAPSVLRNRLTPFGARVSQTPGE